MTTYTLLQEPCRNGFLAAVLIDGGQRHRTASASFTTGPQGDFAIVFVPPRAELVNAPDRQPDWVNDTSGHAMYDFTTHQAALDFLCALYGLDVPQPDPEPVDDECWLCDGCGEVETHKADGTPITVGCPACVQRDRDALIQRLRIENQQLRRALDTRIRPVFPRSVPSPLARDVACPHPLIAQQATERAAFFDAPAYPHPATRNTQ
ncbi:MAG: hypothetical protein ACQEUM_10990 [Pseudomonadota bacterium]